MQYCPLCLDDDDAPYFRRRWRLATRISCFVHGCGLRDRCPACRHGIAAFDQVDLVPEHFCARCGFDLRGAPKVPIKTAARRLERAIDDICRVEAVKGSPATSDLVPRLLRAPKAIDAGSAKSLTSLSTSARIRCFELLAAGPLDWLVAGKDAVVAHRRRSILAAGGHDGLIAGLADVLETHQTRPRSDRPTQPSAGLADLLTAYLRVAAIGPRQSSIATFQLSEPEIGDRVLYSSRTTSAASSPPTENSGMMSPPSSFSFDSSPASSRASKSGKSRSVSRPNCNMNAFVVT